MARAQLTNNASSTLLAGINNAVTALSVAGGAGALFPVVSSYFYCTLKEGTVVEIIKVTARVVDDFTIVRAQDGTTAQSFTTAATISLNLTAAVLAELQETSAKDTSGGYAGLTLFKLNLRNAADTITSWFTTAATVARTWTLPDKDGTVAMLSDIPTGITPEEVGFTLAGGTTSKTLTVTADVTLSAQPAALGANTFTGAQNFARATVASAATTADIWGAAGNQIDWTGTATTTAFPNAPQAGAERVLICAAACSFTAGVNMLIDGVASAATVTCAANDQVIVRAVSTTQFRLSRVKYDGTAQVNPVMTATAGGLVPTPPNNITTFLRGDGTFAPAAGGGGSLVYLSTVTASSASTVDIETTFNSTYDTYVLVVSNLRPSGTASIFLRMKISGAYITSNSYSGTMEVTSSDSTTYGISSESSLPQLTVILDAISAAEAGCSFIMHITNPGLTTSRKCIDWIGVHSYSSQVFKAAGVGMNNTAGALTGLRFYPSAGTFTGTFRLYGIANS